MDTLRNAGNVLSTFRKELPLQASIDNIEDNAAPAAAVHQTWAAAAAVRSGIPAEQGGQG